jgi:hypothetical protein
MNTTLIEWIMSRGIVYISLIILCLVWMLYDTEPCSYEPRHMDLNIIDATKWQFAQIEYASSSIRDSIWQLGISRTLDQLESIRKPTGLLWDSLDPLLDQLKRDLD